MGSGKGGEDNSMMMMQMMQSMANNQQAEVPHMPEMAMPHMPQMPAPLTMPEIQTPLAIDWTERNATLAEKARAEYNLENAARKGRLDTVLTSPLADDDDTDVTQSLLTGS